MPEPARRALLIATSVYDDPALPDLTGAVHDASELADVLGDRDIGDFDVHTVLDRPAHEVTAAIEEFLQACGNRDLALLYITGHGIKGMDGALYFAATNTRPKLLLASAVAASWVNSALDVCRSRNQVVLLDCCHSGAFARGIKAGARAGSAEQLTGHGHPSSRGRVILTASDAIQFAIERAQGDDLVNSVFTSCLVRGLRTGDADLDGDGRVTLDDLFEYVREAVQQENPHQTPEMSAVAVRGEFVIARNPYAQSRLLDELAGDAASPAAHVRAQAVARIGDLLAIVDDQQVRQELLHALAVLRADVSPRVSGVATEVLRNTGEQAALRPQPSPPVERPGSSAVTAPPQPRQHTPAQPRPSASRVVALLGVFAVIAASAAVVWFGIVNREAPEPAAAVREPERPAEQENPTPDPPDEGPAPDQPPEQPALAFDLDDLRWSETAPDDVANPARLTSIVWHDEQFVAAGTRMAGSRTAALVLTSSDGREWEPYAADALEARQDQSIRQIAVGPDGLIAIGSSGTRPDQDAAVWLLSGDEAEYIEPSDAMTDGHREMISAVWHEDRFVAVGCIDDPSDKVCEETIDGSQRSGIWTSADGKEWREIPADRIEQVESTAMHGVTSTADGLVAVGYEQPEDESTRTAALWTSSDGGRSWGRIDLPDPDGANGQALLQVVAYEDGVIAAGYAQGEDREDREAAVWQSTDGQQWDARLVEDVHANDQAMHAITSTGNGFVGVGRHYEDGATRGVVWISDDGRTWTRQQSGDFPSDRTVLRAVASSGDRVVAGGGTGGDDVGELRLWTGTQAD